MKTQSKLVLVKQGKYEYINIYFKFKDKLIRINTGNKNIPKGMTKDLFYNSSVPNYSDLNHDTRLLKKKVDDYVSYRLLYGWRQLSKEECLLYIESGIDSVSTFIHNKYKLDDNELKDNKDKTITELLTEFYQFKKFQLNNRPSYKDYLTLVNSLNDFQKNYKIQLTFDYMNTEDFLVKYRNFLSVDRGKDYKKDGYMTRGGLNDNTINKRFSCLETFFLWVENRDLYTFKKSIHNFSIPTYDNNIVVLDKNDIKQLLEVKITNPIWERMRDVFVFNCFCGLRISDLKTLTPSDFVKDVDGDYILIKENQKTNYNVNISIQQTSLNILKKYDFKLPKFSDQYFNRGIKDLLKFHKLFPEPIVKKRRSNKDNEDKVFLRRELITSHTCRRTFITLGISNNVPLNSLMRSTGHKKIQTLQKYMKLVQDKESFKKIDLEPEIIESNT